MADYLIMGGILAFLLFMLGYKAKYVPEGNDTFFDQQNSKAMRGFWCLIVILVHIPPAYQNTIQDMIGSFAYIGVTFFFMTSAYGLSVGINRKPESIKKFWLTRLPKLIVPNWTANIVFALLFLILFGYTISVGSIVDVNRWVRWLLGCYLAFWIGYRFRWGEKLRRPIVCVLVFALSISVYYLKHIGIVQTTTWCTEAFGFVWGVLLFAGYDKIKAFFCRKWIAKTGVACFISLVLGISYLLFKPVVFWGDYVLKIVLGLSILSFILLLNGKFKIGNRISWFLGDMSFEIFLVHVPVFQIVESYFPGISSGGFIVMSIALTVLFAAMIHKVCGMVLKKLK